MKLFAGLQSGQRYCAQMQE